MQTLALALSLWSLGMLVVVPVLLGEQWRIDRE